jgi:hypothetical protein
MSTENELIPVGTDPDTAQFIQSFADEAQARVARDQLAKTALKDEIEKRDLVIYRRVRISQDRVDLYRADAELPEGLKAIGVDLVLEPRAKNRADRVSELYERFSQEGKPGSVKP